MLHPCPLPLRALAAAALACALSAHAQNTSTAGPAAATATTVRSYDLPPQPLGSALARIAADSGQQISLDAELVRGRTAPAVRGNYTAEQAVRSALAGSGLELVRTNTGNWSLRTLAAPHAAGDGPSLGEVRVSAEAARSATTDHTGSYTARAVTIGKSEQPLKELPQSVSVVTRQLMDEQNATSVYDALGSTTGITLLQSPQGGKYIYSRGFDILNLQFDGVTVQRLYGRASNYSGSSAIYDRAEILRGSAGLLQGGGDPSGTVNFARKRPLKEGDVTVTAKAGSWDRYGAQVDASGALNAEGTLRGRGVIDVEDKHSFIDYSNQRNTTLYGTLEYDLSRQTQISLGASYESFKGRPFISGLPRYVGGADIGLPQSTYLGAVWNHQNNTTKTLFADLSHEFNSRWRAKVSAIYLQEDLDMKYSSSSAAVAPATGLGVVTSAATQAQSHAGGIDANITGAFDAWGREHEVVVGTSFNRTKVNTRYAYGGTRTAVDVFNPNPFRAEPTLDELRANTNEHGIGSTQQAGLYGALRLQVTQPLKLVLGGRLGSYKTDWDTRSTGTGGGYTYLTHQGNTRFMPFAGLIYAINPSWSAYASYADIFNPQMYLDAAGNNLKPITGSTYEVGLKGELFNGRANTSFALYKVKQKNRRVEDIASGASCRDDYYCYKDDGRVSSQGFDAEISGELARGWNLFAGYTYNQNTYERDINNQGLDFNTYTPRHLLRIWTTYQFPGDLSAFTVGGGVDAQSDSYRKIGAVNITAPGRAVWSSYVRYQINKQWQASVNFNNMFDKTYYTSIGNMVNSSHYGDPRNVMLTLRGNF